MTAAQTVYRRLIGAPVDRSDLGAAADEVAPNGLRLLGAHTLTQVGDRVFDPKTVLPYVLAVGGAPTGLVGLLVPLRESGSLLPQVALLGLVQRTRRRRRLLVVAALAQALIVLLCAAAVLLLEGLALGLAVVVCVAGFALARALSSLTNKDVRGRLLPKGERGRVTGLATSVSGVVAIGVGLGVRLLGQGSGASLLAGLLAGAAVLWVLAAGLFATLAEPATEPEQGAPGPASAFALLREDRDLRVFVLARMLLFVSALSPPFLVALATSRTGGGVAGAGSFVVAAGVAAAVGGRAWGSAADRSSRRVMAWAAGLATLTVLTFLAATRTGLGDQEWLYVLAYGVLAVVHTGARVGRKTYVVDLAGGAGRAERVAVANTLTGALLLGVGGFTAVLAQAGPEVALLALAVLGLLGVPAALRLPEVERSTS